MKCAKCAKDAIVVACYKFNAGRRDGVWEPVYLNSRLGFCPRHRPHSPMVLMDEKNWRRIEEHMRSTVYPNLDRGSAQGYWKEVRDETQATEVRGDAGARGGDPLGHGQVGATHRLADESAHADVRGPAGPSG